MASSTGAAHLAAAVPLGDRTTAPPVAGTFVELHLNAFGSYPTDADKMQTEPDVRPGVVEVLWRDQASTLFRQMVHAEADPNAVKTLHYLAGPGGCGKSILLYSLAQLAKARGWLVLYIGNSDRLARLPDDELACRLLDYLKSANSNWPASYEPLDYMDVAGISLPADDLKRKAKRAVTHLRRPHNVALFAVDQWNVIRDDRTSAFFKELFGTFGDCCVERGATLLAVSSSFYAPATGVFRDDDAGSRQLHVKLFTPTEWSSVVGRMRACGQLPALGQGLDDAELQKHCGRVGRMLDVARRVWTSMSSATGRWDKQHLTNLREQAADYYYRRVKSLIDHTAASAPNLSDKRALIDFVVLLFLNKQEPATFQDRRLVPPAFVWAGLYDMDASPFRPLCPSVSVGINRAVSDPSTSVLDIMAKDPQMRRRAFELFVQRAFRPLGDDSRTIELDTTDLHGANKAVTTLVVHGVFQQDAGSPAAVLASLDPSKGSLIICHAGHSVVDMVLYFSEKVFFIQISLESYTDHGTKIDHLLSQHIAGKTVAEFYIDAAKTLWPSFPSFNNRFAGPTKDHVQYIYVTRDTTAHRLNAAASPLMQHVRRAGLTKALAPGREIFQT